LKFALLDEVGELLKLFMWKNDGVVVVGRELQDKVAQELADIIIFAAQLLRFSAGEE